MPEICIVCKELPSFFIDLRVWINRRKRKEEIVNKRGLNVVVTYVVDIFFHDTCTISGARKPRKDLKQGLKPE